MLCSVAACAAAGGRGGDLGAFMVENGYAVAYRWVASGAVLASNVEQAGWLSWECRWKG